MTSNFRLSLSLLKARRLMPLLVIVAGLWAYHNSLRNPFIFDDQTGIVENSGIRKLWPPWEILSHSSRPVVRLSLAVNYALGGGNPWGYHLFNVGVHVLAALTLYGIVRLTFASEILRSRFGEAAPWLAGVISLIWLVHPLQTESVTYIIQRGESLMGLFYLLTLYCVIRSKGSSRSIWWRVGALVSCALGMASKPVTVTAPVMVLLHDRVFLARSWREVLRQRWTLHASLAATWLLLPLLLANAPAEWKDTAGFAYKGIPPLQYALTQPGVILHYLRLAFWPYPLCLDYGWQYGWPVAQTAGGALPELALVGALLVATAWAWRRKPALGLLGAWFFIVLAPTSSFVPIADLIVEHRMYLPLAAVVTAGVVGLYALVGRGSLAVFVLVAIGFGFLTVRRNEDYRSRFSIWSDTVAKRPDNPRARNNLGAALFDTGRVKEAMAHYEQALRIKPDYSMAQNNLAWLLAAIEPSEGGDPTRAVTLAERACEFTATGNRAPAYLDTLAAAYAAAGRFNEAITTAQNAIELARSTGQAQVVREIEARLELYRSGRPYRYRTETSSVTKRSVTQ